MSDESATGIIIPTEDDLGSALAQIIPDIVEALEQRSLSPVGSEAERGNLYPSPNIGQMVLRTDTSQIQMWDGLTWRSKDVGPQPREWTTPFMANQADGTGTQTLSMGSGKIGGYIRQDFFAADFTFHLMRAANTNTGGSLGNYVFNSPVNADLAPGANQASWAATGTWFGQIGGIYAVGNLRFIGPGSFRLFGKYGDIGPGSGSDYGSGWQATDYLRAQARVMTR